ncbi:MAG: flagellar biosynthetic protein FliR, partial [Planctomycetia bacterium]
MDWLIQLNVERFLIFTLVLVRVSGLVVVAPVIGVQQVPMQVRALLAFTLAILIAPTQWDVSVTYPGTMLNYMVFLGSELLIGICLGLGIVILLSAVQLAGQIIGQTSGMMAANIFDPMSGVQASIFARLLYWLAIGVYL